MYTVRDRFSPSSCPLLSSLFYSNILDLTLSGLFPQDVLAGLSFKIVIRLAKGFLTAAHGTSQLIMDMMVLDRSHAGCRRIIFM
jgi:hypothetical protein